MILITIWTKIADNKNLVPEAQEREIEQHTQKESGRNDVFFTFSIILYLNVLYLVRLYDRLENFQECVF